MGQAGHWSATATHAVRTAIQRSQASLATLSRELDINPKTVASSLGQWAGRTDEPHHQGSNCQTLPLRQPTNSYAHLADFMPAYNFARRLKTLSSLTPDEYICKIWASEPERFIINPIHQMPGLNN